MRFVARPEPAALFAGVNGCLGEHRPKGGKECVVEEWVGVAARDEFVVEAFLEERGAEGDGRSVLLGRVAGERECDGAAVFVECAREDVAGDVVAGGRGLNGYPVGLVGNGVEAEEVGEVVAGVLGERGWSWVAAGGVPFECVDACK